MQFQNFRCNCKLVSCTSIVTDMCVALGCQTSDKCYPCPLANGDYSTRTGMLIRDAYQPIFSILQEHLKDLSETGKVSQISLVDPDPKQKRQKHFDQTINDIVRNKKIKI